MVHFSPHYIPRANQYINVFVSKLGCSNSPETSDRFKTSLLHMHTHTHTLVSNRKSGRIRLININGICNSRKLWLKCLSNYLCTVKFVAGKIYVYIGLKSSATVQLVILVTNTSRRMPLPILMQKQ